ncbi:MAG TPA: hypothetical protein PLM38_03090 [Ottowia sp.]|nr:hypothetical protein [Ottowia sp.]
MMRAIDWTAGHVDAFAPSVQASPMRPLVTAERVLTDATLLEYRHGAQRALLAVKGVGLPLGNRLDVVALVSDGERIESGQAIESLRRWAFEHHIDYITMMTARPHIARACARAGWKQTGVVMVGTVNHV